jgi:hypothetical protein
MGISFFVHESRLYSFRVRLVANLLYVGCKLGGGKHKKTAISLIGSMQNCGNATDEYTPVTK